MCLSVGMHDFSITAAALTLRCQPTNHSKSRANDEGQALHAAGRHSAAFDAFTEAIRLRPTSAVYHANRAAAALRLGRPAIAAEDADEAARRDPTYLRAHLRGGRARLQLGQPQAAAACFRAALAADASSTAAAKGLTEAAAMEAAQQRQADAEAEAAQRGARPGLPRGEVPEEQAVLQLHSAEQMLAANPRLQVGCVGPAVGAMTACWLEC